MRSNPPELEKEVDLDLDTNRVLNIISALKKCVKSYSAFQIPSVRVTTEKELKALFEIIDTNRSLWRKCVEEDGIVLFVAILKRQKDDEPICKYASLGLAKMLISPHPDLITPNYHDVDCATAAGAIPALLDVLDRHFHNIEVCINVCFALGHIVRMADPMCVDAQVIPFLLDFIETVRHRQNATLMLHVSNLLYHILKTCLLKDSENKVVVESLITILDYHIYNIAICQVVVPALAALLSKDPSYPAIALAHDARRILLTIQDSHPYGKVESLNSALHSIAKKNFKRHPHVLRNHNNDWHSCDICGASPGNFMGCKACDYDECMMCFDRRRERIKKLLYRSR